MNIKPDINNAVSSLRPNTGFSTDKGEIVVWDTADTKSGEVQPSKSEIDARLKELTDAYNDLEYARKRQAEYPDYATQFDILYHSGVAGLKAELKKTKDKFPK
tara:strand:- start:421 stop:729 length:309 start_codon:yes stop_codon:yes gene_type:complete